MLHKDRLVHGRWRTLVMATDLGESGVEPAVGCCLLLNLNAQEPEEYAKRRLGSYGRRREF